MVGFRRFRAFEVACENDNAKRNEEIETRTNPVVLLGFTSAGLGAVCLKCEWPTTQAAVVVTDTTSLRKNR